MAKRQFSKVPVRSAGLITLGSALLILSLPGQSTKAVLPDTPVQTASPTPNTVQKQSKPVRRRPIRKRTPSPIRDSPLVLLNSSLSSVTVCPVAQHSYHGCSTGSEVELSAAAGSPKVIGHLKFTWNVTGGRLRGKGNKIIWDLSALEEGIYFATVEAIDGNQHTGFDTTKVTVTRCSDCVPGESPCPTISVSCPAVVDLKQPIVFEATVSGGIYEGKLVYTWSVTGGRIVSGQGNSKITVNASKAGQPVTAAITLGGIDPRCAVIGVNTASCRVDEVRQP